MNGHHGCYYVYTSMPVICGELVRGEGGKVGHVHGYPEHEGSEGGGELGMPCMWY